jgi:hypothetical protein
MSAEGRSEAAERWRTGDYGPDSPMARSTKRVCRDCGFFLPLSGSLGALFGVCGNELSADGHIVDKLYGCGAHSDTPAPAGTGSPAYEPYDDGQLDVAQAPVEPSAPPSETSEAAEAQPEPEAVQPQPETPGETAEADTQTEPSDVEPAARAPEPGQPPRDETPD